jgi:murein DD-endopeptidase MepM/ murein hydrolase activator NlpD
MSIFKNTFKDGVKNQLVARQNAILDRTPSSIQYFNARNAWIRMTSAVDVGEGEDKSKLANSYVLLGGTLYNKNLRSGVGSGNQAYSTLTPGGTTNRLGIRPMPGITSIDVKSKAAYGSLREVTVNFQCWDIRQLEELELLYMRPGYTVLLEWGWAPYLDNKGNLQNNIDFTDDVLTGGKSKEDIWKKIYDKSSSDGNYEAMYGFIKNYSWSARPDGGYDCTTNIITMGEIIESLKVNYGAFDVSNLIKNGLFSSNSPQTDPSSANIDALAEAVQLSDIGAGVNVTASLPNSPDSVASAYSQNIVAGICAELYSKAVGKTKSKLDAQKYELYDSKTKYTYKLLRYNLTITNQSGPILNNGNSQIYIKLSSFVEILNQYVLLSDGKKPIAGLSINDSDGQPLLCLGDMHQISTNPAVCLIKNELYNDPATTLRVENLSVEPIKKYMASMDSYYDVNTEFGNIGNIYVNIEYIYKLYINDTLANQDKKEKNDIILFDLIKSIMSGINTAIGNVANFDIFVDPVDSIARIIDVNYVDTMNRDDAFKNAFTLQVHNLNSVVRNYKLESQIFPDQVTTIAIGAQAQGGALGANVNTLIDFNQNLIDRIIPKKDSPLSFQNTTNDPVKDIQTKINALQNNWATIANYFIELQPAWWWNGEYDVEQSSKYANSLKDIINFFNSFLKTDIKNRSIIPTKLSLEMDGIGGMIIGNLFKIPDDVLPRGYKGGGAGPKQIAYVVLGLGHSIQNNDWTTKVDAQFIILDEPRGESKLTIPIVQAINYLATSGNNEPDAVNRPGNNFTPFDLKNVEDSDTSGIDFSKFVYPTNGIITSAFAVRAPQGIAGSEFHRALDIANILNTPIFSICDGEVVRAGFVEGYGDNAVYIKIDKKYHNQNKDYYVIYGHGQAHYVKVGDKVTTGQIIVNMGNQGAGTGPHLHLQIRESATGFDSSTTSLNFGKYFPQKGGTITALLPWGTMK